MPKVAISDVFLNGFAKLPGASQNKVMNFVSKFQSEPASSGINYEKIKGAKDSKLRSVRIDDSYRGIVMKPDSGDVFVLLWVDKHDDAYQWAINRKCIVNPETGALQVYDTEFVDSAATATSESGPALFAGISDRHLKRFGVPEELLPRVKTVASLDELDALQKALPTDAYENLFFLADGIAVDDLLQELEREKEIEVDVEDYAQALETDEAKRHFHVVKDELELSEVLSQPLEKWRVFLHPSQRKLVERDWNGPVRVLGGAGTGKTVAAMHRAGWLVTRVFNKPSDRILVTTFSRNLAEDLREHLKQICPAKALERVEVINLDRWVYGFLRKQGYEFEIAYGDRGKALWDDAMSLAPEELKLPTSFYRDEWETVVQPQGIESMEEYFQATRIGRGRRLTRKDRKLVWRVFEQYRALLDDENLREPDDAMRDARRLMQNEKVMTPYKAVIVDEAQDMGAQAFKLIRQLAPEGPNDLFIVGDAHQRIYRHKVVLGQCGINIKGRGRKLRINYRTTDETGKWATSILKNAEIDDLDAGGDDSRGYKALLHGLQPVIVHHESYDEELAGIVEFLKVLSKEELSNSCLVVRTNNLIEQYESALAETGIETCRLSREKSDNRQKSGLRLATMHRVKGLEFDRILMASMNEGVVPLDSCLETDDPNLRSEAETRERSLVYVAATRAKEVVRISSYGKHSNFLI